jgi:hypothetical protein
VERVGVKKNDISVELLERGGGQGWAGSFVVVVVVVVVVVLAATSAVQG